MRTTDEDEFRPLCGLFAGLLLSGLALATRTQAAELQILLPQGRTAYQTNE